MYYKRAQSKPMSSFIRTGTDFFGNEVVTFELIEMPLLTRKAKAPRKTHGKILIFHGAESAPKCSKPDTRS